MKSLIIIVVVFLVVTTVCVGAFNVVNNTRNKPMPVYKVLQSISDLNFDFYITTDSLDRMIKLFTDWSDWSYRATEEYKNSSKVAQLFTDWKNHSLIIKIPQLIFNLVHLVFSLLFDVAVLLYQLFTLAKDFLIGVRFTP